MINNNLAPPSKNKLRQYGHDIKQLYDAAVLIGGERNENVPEQSTLQEVDREILSLLSDFAQTTRYHNLDTLSSSQSKEDPLAHWNRIILLILEKDVTKRQKEKILKMASSVAGQIDGRTITIMQGLDKAPISTTEALTLPGLHEQASKFAVLRILNIISPLRDLISNLSRDTYEYPSINPFPQMQEFLEWVYTDRQYVLRKRKWP